MIGLPPSRGVASVPRSGTLSRMTVTKQQALDALLAWLVETLTSGRQVDRIRGLELLRQYGEAVPE